MNSLRLSIRRMVSVATAIALMFTTAIPALVSADQITQRSIELSSATKSATNVTYNLKFTPVASAGATALQFCSNSPLIGSSCTIPTGMSVASAANAGSTSVSKPTVAATQGPVVVVEKPITATATTMTITGINNPSAAGSLYVRVVTYDTKANAEADYTATGSGGDNDGIGGSGTAAANAVDNGSIALSITDNIGVSAAVLETLTFCVAGAAITTAGCGGTLTAPTLTLGETSGSVKALSSQFLSTGDIYSQISTNAVGGAVVNLKSSVTCGGLQRFGATVCDIAPAGPANTFTAGEAKFGVKVAPDTVTDGALSATGSYKIATGSSYDATAYRLNWVNGNATGVGSVYGDPILDTLDVDNTTPTQPSNKNMKLTFGASISNNTPAGLYKNDFSMIATGKF